MTKGLCPHCGKSFKSLEIHLGKNRDKDVQAETMRRVQEQLKSQRSKKARRI